jgi:hypothetical protein
MQIFVILFAITFTALYSQNKVADSLKTDPYLKYSALFMKYSNNFHSMNRIIVGGSVAYSNHYLIDADLFSFKWLNKDENNSNRTNISIMPVIDLGILFSLGLIIPNDFKGDNLISPLYITNSTHNFFVFGNPDGSDFYNPPKANLSFFIKNNTDYYIIQSNNWFELSPGAGIKLFYSSLALDFGYERKYQMIDNGKTNIINELFFSITSYIYHLE